MRKKITLLSLGFIVLLCLSCTFDYQVSPEDIALVTNRAASVELVPPDRVEVLYDHNGAPTFLLGLSDSYYLIMGKNSATIYEFAESPNPYGTWVDNTKYYGGFGSYIVEADGQLINARTGLPVSSVPYMEILDEMESATGSSQGLSPLAATPTSATLTWAYDYGQKLSFGLNQQGDPMAGTCTAVALGQILNYLDKVVDSRILSTNYHAEPLVQSGQPNHPNQPNHIIIGSHPIQTPPALSD
jgi:hypothetical protein